LSRKGTTAMKMPKVSVVIPTHNRVERLGRAIRSALAQTFSDVEVLIADDASKDRTGDMVLGMGDPRVRYFRHATNLGVSAARNTAISHARGEFVAFLDDDDEWLPEKLQIQLDHIENARKSVGLLCGGYYEVDRSSNRIAEITPTEHGWVFESLLRQGYFNHTSTILVRAECFARVGLFDVAFRYGEDFDMWLRIAKEYEVDFVPAPVARRHLEPDGLTQDYNAIASGTEAHLRKYRAFFEHESPVLSERLQKLGTYYCFAGNARRGREVFYTAIAHRPLAPKSYIGVALSLMGSRAFRFCYAAKDRIA
jgi:glycosyltransferase involved in cell wall biosynthesis